MLLGGKQSEIKPVAVVTRNQQFRRLLGSILADWKYTVVEDLAAAKIVFVERGLELPSSVGHVVWLTPMPLIEGSFLTVPISLTSLYYLLEVNFFPNPRRHIRVVMENEVDLQIENEWQEGSLISLSDRGGRIACAKEILRGQVLQIEVKLARKTLRIPAEVLYCIPAGDSSGRLQPQVGVLFKPSSDQECNMRRCFIEKTCVERACSREKIPLSALCLSWIDLLSDPWNKIA
jgi:hypothetical protein